jgi:predicted DNA-binding WGR domain protein
VQPNLFGTVSLMREWGRIGRSSRVQIDLHETEEDAARFMQRKIREKQRRGYV